MNMRIIAFAFFFVCSLHGMDIEELFSSDDTEDGSASASTSGQEPTVEAFSVAQTLLQLLVAAQERTAVAQEKTAVAQEKTNELLADLVQLRTIQTLNQIGASDIIGKCMDLGRRWEAAEHALQDKDVACKSSAQRCILEALLGLKERHLSPRVPRSSTRFKSDTM